MEQTPSVVYHYHTILYMEQETAQVSDKAWWFRRSCKNGPSLSDAAAQTDMSAAQEVDDSTAVTSGKPNVATDQIDVVVMSTTARPIRMRG